MNRTSDSHSVAHEEPSPYTVAPHDPAEALRTTLETAHQFSERPHWTADMAALDRLLVEWVDAEEHRQLTVAASTLHGDTEPYLTEARLAGVHEAAITYRMHQAVKAAAIARIAARCFAEGARSQAGKG